MRRWLLLITLAATPALAQQRPISVLRQGAPPTIGQDEHHSIRADTIRPRIPGPQRLPGIRDRVQPARPEIVRRASERRCADPAVVVAGSTIGGAAAGWLVHTLFFGWGEYGSGRNPTDALRPKYIAAGAALGFVMGVVQAQLPCQSQKAQIR